MTGILQDLRHAVRGLLRNPGFTIVAVLTLALGIGANLAVFTVADAFLFRPLPYRDAERLVELAGVRNPGTPRQTIIHGMTRGDIDAWRAHSQIFEAIESYREGSAVVGNDTPERIDVTQLSPGMLDFLQAKPALGRGFRQEETTPGTDGVVLIGEGLWKTRFGGDPHVLGRTLTVSNRQRVVIGVMPLEFRFPKGD